MLFQIAYSGPLWSLELWYEYPKEVLMISASRVEPVKRVVGGIAILTLAVTLTGTAVFAGPLTSSVAGEKFLDVSSFRPPTQEAVNTFRKVYRERNMREFGHLSEGERHQVVSSLEQCLELGYQTRLEEVNSILLGLDEKYPDEPVLQWHLGMNYFLIARRLERKSGREEQILLFRKGIEKTEACLVVAPLNADCQLVYAASRGALALVQGIFATISEMASVRDGFHRAYELSAKEPYPLAPWGVDTQHAARGALAEFYRLAPDWWLFKVVSGVRGDKEKSWFYASQMSVNEVGTANIVARSALCYGADSSKEELIGRALEVLKQGVTLDLIQSFDEPEYRRLARLYNGIVHLKDADEASDYYELGCHEFGNDDKSQLRAKKSSANTGRTEVGLND